MKFTLLLVLAAITGILHAQAKTVISGKVTDTYKQPLGLVTIFIEGTSEGTISGENGEFTLQSNTKGKVKLIATLVGYNKQVTGLYLQEGVPAKCLLELEEKVTVLKEAVITASSFGSVSEKGVVMKKIDILMTPGGAADIFQSIKTLPGLTQVSESAELYVRGGDPMETLTIIDGAPVYHPFTMESTYGALFSNVRTNFIKNLYFSSGGFSAKYGNALSGVLAIETEGLPATAAVNAGVSLANTALSFDVPFIEKIAGLRFSYDRSMTSPLFWLNGGADRFTITPVSQNITGSFAVNYSGTGKVKLLSVFADDEQGVEVERPEYAGTFNGNSNSSLYCFQWSDLLAKSITTKISISQNTYNNHWLLGNLDLAKKDKVLAIRKDMGITLSHFAILNAGLEAEERTIQYTGTVPVENYDIRPEGTKKVIDTRTGFKRYAAYLEYENARVASVKSLSGSIGIRGDYIQELGLFWMNPRFNTGYTISEHQKVMASFGVFTQLPDMRLYNPVDGNTALGAMKAYHYIAAYQYDVEGWMQCRIEGYYKKYLDLPKEDEIQRYSNNGYGYAKGVDIILKANTADGFEGWLSYGFIKSKRFWMDCEKESSATTDITHNVSCVLKYAITSQWHTGLNMKYATGRPYTPITGGAYNTQQHLWEPVESPVNSGRFPGYRRVDLRVTHFNSIGNTRVVAFFEGLNILNLENIFGYSYAPDYSSKKTIRSYFGKRTIVFGCNLMW